VSGVGEQSVRVWDAQSGTQLKVLGTHSEAISSLALAPSSDDAAALEPAARGGDAATAGTTRASTPGDGLSLPDPDADPTAQRAPRTKILIATASRDCSSHVLDCSRGTTVHRLGGVPRGGWPSAPAGQEEEGLSHRARIDVVAWSPCGLYLATGSHDKTVRVWQATTGASVSTLRGHRGDISALLFTKHSDTLLTCSTDHSCCVWAVESGHLLAALAGHSKPVRCVAYSKQTDRAATGGNDRVCVLWNLRTAANNVALRGHSAAVSAVAISPDARQIFSGARDKILSGMRRRTGILREVGGRAG
jgi:WD40 repeat protein